MRVDSIKNITFGNSQPLKPVVVKEEFNIPNGEPPKPNKEGTNPVNKESKINYLA